jgi:hypothetical protein
MNFSINKNTLIQIFYDRIGEKKFLAFDLYIYSLYDILKTKFENVFFISNIKDYQNNENSLLIIFLNDLNKYVSNFGYKIKNNCKIIFIHADMLLNHSKSDRLQIKRFVNDINSNNCVVWEYSSLNINLHNKFLPNIKYRFLPLLYSDYLENFYNSRLTNGKIPWDKKDIDVIFIGNWFEDRRPVLLDKLKQKFNLLVVTGNNNYDEMINLIERSKIFIHIYSKNINKSFDYYRLSLLYSNKVFTITETPMVLFHIEKNLLDIKDHIVTSNYEDFEENIEKYLNKPYSEINEIVDKIYDNFKKTDFKEEVLKFFS